MVTIPALLISTLLLAQIPLRPNETGTVTGTLTGADGKPVPYVRITAVAPPETINDRTSAAMSSLAETDTQGRFALEGVPQGRYYIAAGRVDGPTYYPGTQDMQKATILSVMSGATIAGIDFVMNNSSTRTSFSGSADRLYIPMQVVIEGGGKIPLFSPNGSAVLQLGPSGGSVWAPFTAHSVELPLPADLDAHIEGLPEGYSLVSLRYGTMDLSTMRLQFPRGATSTSARPSTITVTLRFSPPVRPTTGVRVAGRARGGSVPRSIYLSGRPGTYYDDGTFEFYGVPPGRYLLAGLDIPSPLGAIVVVGERDVEGVELRETATPVPFNLRSAREPEPLGAATPGLVLPLPSLRGVVLNEESQKPLTEGSVKITGYAQSRTIPIGPDGRYEIPKLFPGTYTLDVEAWGHAQMSHSVTVGTENITFDITTRRLY